MADSSDTPQVPSKSFLWCFHRYLDRSLPKNFHTLSLLDGCAEDPRPDEPLIIALNHPSWWDLLLGLYLCRQCFPKRTFYSPMDAAALEKYGMFKALGVYGVDQSSLSGARKFLRDSRAILSRPGASIWITPQGRFTDPRDNPELEPGLGHLVAGLASGVVLPLAAEYPFWEERLPEGLACFGDPLVIADHPDLDKHGWTERIHAEMAAASRRLTAASIAREADRFVPVLRGKANVGGFYDLGRRIKSAVTGKSFDPAHGTKLNQPS